MAHFVAILGSLLHVAARLNLEELDALFGGHCLGLRFGAFPSH
jgi:hypothetical protein